ncbi:dihydroorotase [Helicobacter cetorum]|uniref:Dihydroorotase n=1 Tax=Helicobacter cetorum (strain ATCC BAA-540 / CCUG 52418 / MIT 99-5656) TaxID=1163745 RepID=I0EQT3_HELCM|nr:dihydroorotase [Helicobacter cetorum]AFI05302.1 dihydroorotase [Helicobacter cetorum MIT 99-5656]
MEITLFDPIDTHLHVRENELLKAVLNYSSEPFSAAVVMPNLSKPLINTQIVLEYEEEILKNSSNFKPLMSLYFNDNLTLEELQLAKHKGIKLLKLYPKGMTTNAQNGTSDLLSEKTLEILENAQNLGFILCVHAEQEGFCLDKEFLCHSVIETFALLFPKLKIIIEHLSDWRSIALLEKHANLYATLTLHHISMTLDDLLGGSLNPHCFCKPLIKTQEDQERLLSIALKAHPKVSFGSDSAPHFISKKHSDNIPAGIFSAPILLPALCELFEKHNALENLQAFVSDNAKKIYALDNLPSKKVRLSKKPFIVPTHTLCADEKITILKGGETLSWNIQEIA